MDDAPFPPGAVLATYLRDSGGASQEASVAQQEAEIRTWCAARGYELPEELIFRDVKRSSKNGTVGRKAFLAMTDYFAGGGAARGLLLWDLTRWGREFKSSLRWFLDIDMRGVKICTVSEPIPEGPFGFIYVILKLMAAEEENKRKGKDIKRAMRQIYLTHNGHVGAIPYGYRPIYTQIGEHRDGTPRLVRRLEPDPEQAATVAEMYRLRALGHSLLEIRRTVGLERGQASYRHMLSNPVYAGRWQWGDLSDSELIPALVDLETWERVQAINAERTEAYRNNLTGEHHPRRQGSSYLLSGLLHCGACGQRMNGKTSTPPVRKGQQKTYTYHFYECSGTFTGHIPCQPRRRYRAEQVEERVMARLRDLLTTESGAAELHAQIRSAQSAQPAPRTDDQAAKLAHLRREIDNITRMIKAGARSMALAREQEALEDQAAELEKKIRAKPARRGPAIPEHLDPGALAQIGAEAWRAIELADARERQLWLRLIVARVRVVRLDTGEFAGDITLREVPGLGNADGVILPL